MRNHFPDPRWPALPSLAIPSRGALRNSPLRGARVLLTPLESADGPELWDVVESSRTHLQRWLPWVPFNTSIEASQRYAETCAADWDAGRAVRFGIRDIKSGELLGVVSLDACIHLHRSCDLGYWLRQGATGKGLMTEAASLCVKFALGRMEAHRVRCAAATDNHQSLAVIGRLRFRFEGIARCAEFVDSRWIDHAVFSRLATDTDAG
jgi:ribosomal-protein-serine acetyltransferase